MPRYHSVRACLALLAVFAGSAPLHAAQASAVSPPQAAAQVEAGTQSQAEAETQTQTQAEAEASIKETRKPYLLKEGDGLEVSVWREETLRKELKVLPDGSITFPLVGRVVVAGLAAGEVEKRIAERLKSFLSDPVVTVVVAGINGNRAYVIGNVIKPGPFVLDAPMTVLQALSLAGGLGKFADEDAIKVLRGQDDGQEILPVRYKDLIKAKDLTTNVQLRAGDTILVP